MQNPIKLQERKKFDKLFKIHLICEAKQCKET